MSFAQGLSGLNAASRALDNVGNNIANSQTFGFKSGSVAFADIFAGAQGMGVQVAGANQNFNDGGLTGTGRRLDMGISGNGFFRMIDASGQASYTRNGQFDTDKEGNIYNATNGLFLTGYQATGKPLAIQQGAPIGQIKIDKTAMSPEASSGATLKGNLNSEDEVPKTTPFDSTKPDSYNYTSTIEAYDSLGNKHIVDVYYVKTDDGKWTAHARDSTAPGVANDGFTKVDLEFDTKGELTAASAKKLSIVGSAYNGADPLSLELDLSGISQHASSGGTKFEAPSVDGHQAGDFVDFQIGTSGEIVVNYSNGEKQTIAQVVLADFANTSGLQQNGNNTWLETPQSGTPVFGAPGNGSLGSITGGALESSNVDLGNEMINMIVYQRNYQSNSQTIKTQSELLQTLVNLR